MHWFITNEYSRGAMGVGLHLMSLTREYPDLKNELQIRVFVNEKRKGHAKSAIRAAIAHYRYYYGMCEESTL